MSVFYVSDVEANGVNAGSATGNGSKAHPFLSIQQALAAEKNGDVIRLNGTFNESVVLKSGVSLESVSPGSATIDGTVTIATDGQKVSIGAITINAGGNQNAIMLDTENQTYSVTMRGTNLAGASGYAIAGQSNLKVNLTTVGVNFSANTSHGMLGLNSLAAGSVNVEGGQVSISNLITGKVIDGSNQVGGAVIGSIEATSSGVHVSVHGVTATGNLNAADGAAAGLQVMNVADASLKGNIITLTGSATQPLRGISVTYDFLHPIDSSGAAIADNTVYDYATSKGVLYYIGTNGTSGPAGYADDATVADNIGIGNPTAGQKNDLHGVLVGYQTAARVEGNQMTDTALAYAMKDDFGTSVVMNNVDHDTSLTIWYTKGSTGVEWIGNKSIQDAGWKPNAFYVGPDSDEADGIIRNSTATLIEGNTIQGIVKNGVVIVEGSSALFPDNNLINGPATFTAQDFANLQKGIAADALRQLQTFVQAAASFGHDTGTVPIYPGYGAEHATMMPTILTSEHHH